MELLAARVNEAVKESESVIFTGGIKKKNTPKIEEEETFAFTRRSLSPSGAATAGTAALRRDESDHIARMY